MNVTIERYLGCNITVVLDRLELASISRDKIRAAMEQAVLVDAPELLMVVTPSGVGVQVSERRVVSGDQSDSAPGKVDLWAPMLAVVSAIDEPRVVAYGFNYDVLVALKDVERADEALTRVFLPTAHALEQSLGVRSLSSIPRLIYYRNSVRYDLRLEAMGGAGVQAHLNAHFASDSLPERDALVASFIAQSEEIRRVLGAL